MTVLTQVVFYMLAVLTLVPAVLAVTVKNVFHAALFLVLSLTGVGGFFALLGADFLFVSQILVYAGGITVLLLFIVFLSGNPKDWAERSLNGAWGVAGLVCAFFISLLTVLFHYLPEAKPLAEALPTTGRLGLLLLRDMLLPFEAVSLLLLSSLAGAIHFSKRKHP